MPITFKVFLWSSMIGILGVFIQECSGYILTGRLLMGQYFAVVAFIALKFFFFDKKKRKAQAKEVVE